MEYFALLKMLHGVAGVLLFVAFFALAGLCWRSRTRTVAAPEAGGETEMDAALAPVAQGLAPTDPDPAREAWETTAVEAPRPSPWPALCAVLLLLCLAGLPVSGWWLAHLAARQLAAVFAGLAVRTVAGLESRGTQAGRVARPGAGGGRAAVLRRQPRADGGQAGLRLSAARSPALQVVMPASFAHWLGDIVAAGRCVGCWPLAGRRPPCPIDRTPTAVPGSGRRPDAYPAGRGWRLHRPSSACRAAGGRPSGTGQRASARSCGAG